jgi:hypothetical protein
MESLSSKYVDIDGWVRVSYADPKLVINYSIKNGPKECDKCKLAIYDGKKCSKLGDPYYNSKQNPWKVRKTIFLSNNKGRAAGFFKVNNGYKLWRNKNKFVVLFDKNDKKIGCGKLIPDGKKK